MNNQKEKIVCAVVVYGINISECMVYKTFIKRNLSKIDCLLVFDNSPISHYEEIHLANGVFEYYWNPKNPGVSVNYNKAAEYAVENNYKWILLLDQDTTFPSDAWDLYNRGLEDHPDVLMFVPKHRIMTGKYISPSRPFRSLLNKVPSGFYDINKFEVINSGLMIRVDKFIEAGGYNASVELDFSDFQFVERIRRFIRNVLVLDIECLQDFSNMENDKGKLLKRFEKYCDGAVNFETDSLNCKLKIAYLVIKHTVALSLRCRTFAVYRTLWCAIINKNII